MRQPRLLPESLDADAVERFVASLRTHRDRAMVWAMLFGGLRSAEVRSLRLADIDFGRRRVRVLGKGSKERVVPVDAAFFTELSALARSRSAALRCASIRRSSAISSRAAALSTAGGGGRTSDGTIASSGKGGRISAGAAAISSNASPARSAGRALTASP